MWSTEIEDILRTTKNFLGCYPLDELPYFPRRLPASLIVNTDTSIGNGDHWLALVLEKDKCFYFDSFGLPIVEDYILKFIEQHYNVVTYSDVCIQDIKSNKCGKFCILFVQHVRSKTTYDRFLSKFSHTSLKKNDVIVEQWLGRKMYKT